MNSEQAEAIKRIHEGYHKVVYHLLEQRDEYIRQVEENEYDYTTITADDVVVWLIESF